MQENTNEPVSLGGLRAEVDLLAAVLSSVIDSLHHDADLIGAIDAAVARIREQYQDTPELVSAVDRAAGLAVPHYDTN
jgi:hypothetical protein